RQAGPHPVRARGGDAGAGARSLRARGREAADRHQVRGAAGLKDGTMKRSQELRGKTADELNDELMSLRKEQFNLRFQRATGQLANAARVRTVRRDIARIKTLLHKQAAKA